MCYTTLPLLLFLDAQTVPVWSVVILSSQLLYSFFFYFLFWNTWNNFWVKTGKLWNRMKNTYIPFTQSPQMLAFYHICFIISLRLYANFFFLNHLGVSCRHDAHLPLNSSVCISPNTRTFDFRIVIKFSKSTLLHCYLIYRLYLTSSCPDNVLYSKRKKNGFLALICDVNCRHFLLVCHLTLFIVIFFLCKIIIFKFLCVHLFICLNDRMVTLTF